MGRIRDEMKRRIMTSKPMQQKVQQNRPRFSPLTLAIHAALLGMAVAVAAPAARAQSAAAGSEASRSYRIEAGPLGEALVQFAAQSGVRLSFDATTLAGQSSPGLQGSYSVKGGFARLLGGSGYVLQELGDGSYALQARRDQSSLPAVTVTAQGEGSATEGSGSYTATGPSATATRMGLSLRETPQSVTVITRQQMDDQALTNVSEVLEKTTGITVGRNDSERFTFYSRGYQIENFQFDGIPNTMDAANQYTTSLADSAIYDRVEIVRGATGLLTGAGYPSAVVNLVRKKPTREFAASVEAGAGSWGRRRLVADVSTPINEAGTVRGRVVAAGQNSDSFTDHYSRDTRNAYAIVEADLTPHTLLSLGVDYMETRADGASFGHIPLFYSDGSPTNFPRSWNPAARWAYWNNSSSNVFATLKHDIGGGWKIDLAASHLSQRRDAVFGTAYYGTVDRATGAGISMLSGTNPSQAQTDAFSATLTGNFPLLGRTHDLSVGANYSRQNRDAQNYNTTFTAIDNYFAWNGNVARPAAEKYEDWKIRIVEKGLSLATRLRPTDALSVILGARASWYDLLDKSTAVDTGLTTVANDLHVKRKITPYAGVVYDINKQWSAYASVTDIFNPQTYYKDAGGGALPPLTGRAHEVGIKAELLDRKLNASLALFHIRQNNAPQYVDVNPATGEEIYVPISGVTSRGVEMELSGSITPAWNLFAGYTFRTSSAPAQPDAVLSAVNTNQPKHLFKLGTSYRLPDDWSRWTVGGNLTWQSDTYFQQSSAPYYRADQPSYAVVGLMAHYEFSRKLSATLHINNLLDKTYMPGLGSYGTGMYGDPRNVLLTMKYAF
jgi:outer membrane receptor for ferric coprogen and ferric-rhodotorulic acid